MNRSWKLSKIYFGKSIDEEKKAPQKRGQQQEGLSEIKNNNETSPWNMVENVEVSNLPDNLDFGCCQLT